MEPEELILFLRERIDADSTHAQTFWMWLPSYQAAKRGHGDGANEMRPNNHRLLAEADLFARHGFHPSPEQIVEGGYFYKCPCGLAH